MKSASTGSMGGLASSGGHKVACDVEPLVRRAEHAENGFSLLEALVALTVLAISLAAFSPSFGAAARNFAQLESRLTAQQLAASLIEERTAVRVLAPGVTRGRSGIYTWQVAVTAAAEDLVPDVVAPWALFEVVVLVDWGGQRRLQVQTLHLGRLQ